MKKLFSIILFFLVLNAFSQNIKTSIQSKICDYESYLKLWHNPPICQGNSGTCWCYATTSFFESEIKRTQNIEVKLSEMYTVYWEYVERAYDFVKTRGKTSFTEGSEATSIPEIWKKYGIVPSIVFDGKPKGQKFNNHQNMISEMKSFLNNINETNNWNFHLVDSIIRSILDKELGRPPSEFVYNGITYTPKFFLKEVLKLELDDYYSFMSTISESLNEKHELVEDDNWRHYSNYYNISIEDFLKVISNATKNGSSVCICGDISEPLYENDFKLALVPDYDLPVDFIDDNARQLRLDNGTTTDDHCVQIVGVYYYNNKNWYLIKDSNYGAFDGENFGYRFYSEDYIKLKMMNILVHKNMARPILDKIIK